MSKKLYEKVLERGAIVSEFPIGSHPAPESFPVRNRIIAGMPIGVIMARKRYSGSLITARLAMEFGTEVFLVPGNVTPEVSFAPNLLIKQGAKLVTNAEDDRGVANRGASSPSAAGSGRIGTTQSVPHGRPKSNRKRDLRAAQRRRIAPHC